MSYSIRFHWPWLARPRTGTGRRSAHSFPGGRYLALGPSVASVVVGTIGLGSAAAWAPVPSASFEASYRLQSASAPEVVYDEAGAAQRWWDTLSGDERVAALYGESATEDEDEAARLPYAELDGDTKELVDAAAAELYGAGGFDSVGEWWETLDCRLARVAAGDGNEEDLESPYCAHYPGSETDPILGEDEREQVDEVGVALFDFPDAGIFPTPITLEMANRWWDELDSDQRVAALYGEGGTEKEREAATRVYLDLFSSTKKLVNDTASELYGDGEWGSVGTWWQTLDCRLKRVATGEGNEEDASSPFCANYPGSGQEPVLGAAEKAQVDAVGQALLGRDDPGIFPPPPDVDYAMRWWTVLQSVQRWRAAYGLDATEEQIADASRAYDEISYETKVIVNDLAAELYGTGDYASVGDWWQPLDCRQRRIAMGTGNDDDPTNVFCASYPGSGEEPILGFLERRAVDVVGQTLLGLDDPGVYAPAVEERINRVHQLALTEFARHMHAGSVAAVTTRMDNAMSSATELRLGHGLTNPLANMSVENLALLGTSQDALWKALAGKTFDMSLSRSAAKQETSGLAVWASSDYRELVGGRRQFVRWEGGLRSVHLGIDMRLGPQLLAGVMGSSHEGYLDYSDVSHFQIHAGKYDVTMTSVNPYLMWKSRAGRRVWAVVGSGEGEATLTDEQANGPRTTPIAQTSVAMGSLGDIFQRDYEFWGVDYRTVVTLKGEAMYTSMSGEEAEGIQEYSGTNRRVKIMLEVINSGGTADGIQHMQYFALGGRNDQGDGFGASGAVREGGFLFRMMGLTLRVDGHYLNVDPLEAEEQGISGMLQVDPGPSDKGFWMRVAPSWGTPKGAGSRVWESGFSGIAGLGILDRTSDRRLSGVFGYGFPAFQGRGTLNVYSGLTYGNRASDLQRVGMRLRLPPALSIDVEGTRRVQLNSGERARYGVELRGALRW